MSLRIMIAGGGTGGHVYPALAVVEHLRRRYPNAEFLWFGNPDKIEATVAPNAGVAFEPLKVTGFSRKLDPKSIGRNIIAVSQAAGAMRKSRGVISKYKPHIAIGTGGYVSGPPIAQAAKMRIPSVLIEPNSYPGLTVRWLANRVERIFLGYEEAMKYLPKEKCILSGTPVLSEFITAKREDGIHAHGLLSGKPCLVFVGGSQGAVNINKAVLEFIEITAREEPALLEEIQILHQTGGKGPVELEGIRVEYPSADYVHTPYIDRMAFALAAADLIISRAGAATINEIKARGLPSILIPYPHAAEGHQLKNALAMADSGAAVIIADERLNGRSLFETVVPLMKDPDRRQAMGDKAKEMYRPDCLDVITGEIIKLVGEENF